LVGRLREEHAHGDPGARLLALRVRQLGRDERGLLRGVDHRYLPLFTALMYAVNWACCAGVSSATSAAVRMLAGLARTWAWRCNVATWPVRCVMLEVSPDTVFVSAASLLAWS